PRGSLPALPSSLSSCAAAHPQPPFPTRRSSDLREHLHVVVGGVQLGDVAHRIRVRDVERALHLGAVRLRAAVARRQRLDQRALEDRKSTRLNSSHVKISYAGFCLKKKKTIGSSD